MTERDWSLGSGLRGRGVVVTGAAGGIGRAVAQGFAGVGARVLAVDLDESRVSAVAGELDGTGHCWMACDLTDPGQPERIIATAARELGDLYVLAHVAAVLRRRINIDEVTEEDWDLQLDTNLKAAFFLCRTAAQAMVLAGGGRIIVFSSQGWWTGGFGGSVVYAASKGGVVSMARGLARTYGPHGITVNVVAPGQINTPMLLTGLDPQTYERMRRETPLGYVGDPYDVAGVVVFLGSDHARYISGATINVSGGFLMY